MKHEDEGSALVSEYLLSNVEAVVAGTLALMTAMAQGCCEAHGRAIREKVIANLMELGRHEGVSHQFQAVAAHLQQHWCSLGTVAKPEPAADPSLWHATPTAVH